MSEEINKTACECPPRKALEKTPCKCETFVRIICPICGATLQHVTNRGGSLNDEQFASVRAGDYYCTTCKGEEARTGYKYWWKRDLETRLDVCDRCAALSAPCPCEGMRMELAVAREGAQFYNWKAATVMVERDSLRAELAASQERERVLWEILQESEKWLREISSLTFLTAKRHVMCLPCICDTPELHSDKCVRIRIAANAIKGIVERAAAALAAVKEQS